MSKKEPDRDLRVRYVAFCDILGFSDKILNNFDETFEIYQKFCLSLDKAPIENVQVTIYSDAILITGEALDKLLSAVQSLWFVALSYDLMIRGAITQGRYWELRKGNHMFIASDALVRAVKLEKFVGIPAVCIADDIEIPDHWWMYRFEKGVINAPLLHFRDRNIVNPFNRYWLKSAKIKATKLMDKNPAYKDKYLWFLSLHDAVANNQELIPSWVLAKYIQLGILQQKY